MTHRILLILLILGILTGPTAAVGEQTKVCPPGQIDVLDWATLDADLRSSKHMVGNTSSSVLYTVVWPDKFYWLKTSAGDTWDIDLYDDTYIYQWITETGFGTPTNYKRYIDDTNAPWMLRCARPGLPGEHIEIPDTTFAIATSCQESSTASVGHGLVEFWGPYTAGKPGLESWRAPIGGDIPNNTPVYVVAWYWDCDAFYTNCSTKEEYILAQRYGLVEWTAQSLQNGSYVVDAIHPFNHLVNGTKAPNFPCF
jgi:hypothetical protein